jgi:hypothetical protein
MSLMQSKKRLPLGRGTRKLGPHELDPRSHLSGGTCSVCLQDQTNASPGRR